MSYICNTVRFICRSLHSIHPGLPWQLCWFLKIYIQESSLYMHRVMYPPPPEEFNHPKILPLCPFPAPHPPTQGQGLFEGLVSKSAETLTLTHWNYWDETTGVQQNTRMWFLPSGCPLEAGWEACINFQKEQKRSVTISWTFVFLRYCISHK